MPGAFLTSERVEEIATFWTRSNETAAGAAQGEIDSYLAGNEEAYHRDFSRKGESPALGLLRAIHSRIRIPGWGHE